jgi:hypothetical protein
MLRSLAGYIRYSIGAKDRELGRVRDFYFDDRCWIVRYVIVDIGPWQLGRRVLISSQAITHSDAEGKTLDVSLTAEQVKDSPSIDAVNSVSREMESQLAEHFGWSRHWPPSVSVREAANLEQSLGETTSEGEGLHLRSANEVTGYFVEAADGPIGRVEDLIIEDEGWSVRCLAVLAPRASVSSRKVLVAKQWVTQVSWTESKVRVDVLREAVKDSPEYDPSAGVNRAFETHLYDYYGRHKYCV